MVNGLGVVGWGVGGIEAEAAMLGQPSSMLIPAVVGYRLTGRLPEGATATDLVLTITEALRKKGVVGKFVEFYGPGLAHLTIADRVTLGNMCPEYGATVAIFPIDEMTLEYLRLTGRDKAQVALVEAYARAQGLFRTDSAPDAVYSETLELDLASVVPSLAGPRRPQDRVTLSNAKSSFAAALPDLQKGVKKSAAGGGTAVAVETELEHGSVVIAAITSCTNTSNPSVMIGAGLVAKKAVEKGLTRKPWVKTSLAPGSKVVTEYLEKAGLQTYLNQLGFNLVGYGCTTCIGNSGPLPDEISAEVRERGLVVASVLSGNRNFEGRIQQDVRANYLASPPLVVAYALVGSMNVDITKEPLGTDRGGRPVYLKDIWPTEREVQAAVLHAVTSEMFTQQYSSVFDGDHRWQTLPVPTGDRFAWESDSTYIRKPPFLEHLAREPKPSVDIASARVLAVLGDSITTDHISPAGSIKADSPAGQVPDRARRPAEGLQLVRRPPRQPRGDDAGHVRQRAPAQPARAGHRRRRHHVSARHRGDVDLRRLDEVPGGRRPAAGTCWKGIRLRLLTRLGGEGDDAARSEGGDRGELRAHSPEQPREHGRPAAAVSGG
jgi:aconitate hydratase